MKRIIAAALAALLLGGCSSVDIVGEERVEALRDAAAGYDSGRYIVTNLSTGEVEQTFTFMFDGEGRQIYLCTGVEDGGAYAEYSDGRELFREIGGEARYIRQNEADYAAYDRDDRHPYSSGELFFYSKRLITSAKESISDGKTVYTYTYDAEKLAGQAADSDGGRLSGFFTEYIFDETGLCEFIQTSEFTLGDGKTAVYRYGVSVEDINSVTEIENPIELSDTE